MSPLEYAIRKYCEVELTKEDILDYDSHIIAYSILRNESLNDSRHVDPTTILTEDQLDDFNEISSIINKVKYDLRNFDVIL